MRETKILADLLDITNDWDSLKKELEKYNTVESNETKKKTQAGKLFEYFAKYYFLTEPTQKINYKYVWLYNEVPPSILEKLELPYKDYGIDLILLDNYDNFVAVQCKFKNDESSIISWSKDKLGNAFGLASNCEKVIVFTNAADVIDIAKSRKTSYEQICYPNLVEISEETFKDLKLVATGQKPSPHQKKTPRSHQERAISAVVTHLDNFDRCQLILPCGAGKTLTALWIKENLKAKKTLVLVPSLALLRQIKNDWTSQRGTEFDYVCVCSEKDIDNDREDTIEIKPSEIGGPVNTDFKRIASFLNQDKEIVIFSTYQSIEVIARAIKLTSNWSFDLIISDEAHRTSGSVAKSAFTIVHNNKIVPSKKRIYMTATPKVVSKSLKSKLGEDYQFLCDMSQEEIFGKEAFKMSFAEAIEKGILCQYKIVGVGISDYEVKRFIDKRQYTGKETATDIAHNFALSHVMEKYGAFHALSFHSRVNLAKAFSERHSSFFNGIYSRHLEGKNPTAIRNRVLREFRNSHIGVIANARCLTEGVDVPTIDLIYFCDPKTSKIDIVQSAGRALRIDPTGRKKEGLIVVPLFHHISEDIEKEIARNEVFNHLVTVIRSLCEHDERLMAEINSIATGKKKRSNKRIEITSVGLEPEKIIELEGFEEKVRKSLFTEIIDRTKDSWEIFFQKFKDYLEKSGTPYIERIDQETRELGRWCAWQRTNKSKGFLTQDRVRRLTEAGFSWAPSDEKWEKKFNLYVEFRKRFSKSNITVKDIELYPEYYELHFWFVMQKKLYWKNLDKYPKERYERLLKEGFDFNKTEFDKKWFDNLQKLKEFKIKHGHCNPSQVAKDPSEKKLGVFLNAQRVLYKGRSIHGRFIKLSEEKIELLNDIGISWNTKDDGWEKAFDDLKLFKEKNGHFNIPQTHKLYFRARRLRLKKDLLSNEQLSKLNSIDFYENYAIEIGSKKFKPYPESNFNKRFNQLLELKEKYGTVEIKSRHKEFSGLYYWLKDIKEQKDRLTKSQISRLESIGINLNLSYEEKKFNLRFEGLKAHLKKYGTLRVSEKINKPLHHWIGNAIQSGRKWTSEQRSKLESIGFFEEYSQTKQDKKPKITFEEIFSLLREYWSKYKTFYITERNREYRHLYNWKQKKEKGLTKDQEHLLDSIGFFTPDNHTKKIKTLSFDERYKEMLAYKEKYGTINISRNDAVHRHLLHWQSHIKRSRILTGEQKEKLKDLGMEVKISKSSDLFSRTFNARVQELEKFRDKFGTTHIKRTNIEYRELYNWTVYIKRRALLTKEQIQKLKSIGFDTSNIEKFMKGE